jgi:hypothetical protein
MKRTVCISILAGLIVCLGSPAAMAATGKSPDLPKSGHGATYEPTTTVKVAGFSGLRFDGRLVGPEHVFVPFSPPSNAAGGKADAIVEDGVGHAFRLIVLNVRGKTVVVFIGSLVMSADQFTTFLPEADGVLKSLKFPRGG